MKSLFLVILAAMISIYTVQQVYGQDTIQSQLKNGFIIEQIGKLTVEGSYIEGRKEGIFLTYYPTGILNKVEHYQNGKKNGLVIEIDNKGTITSQESYLNDKLDGVSKSYARAGKLNWEKNFKKNKLHGLSRIYYDGGVLQEEAWYQEGRRDSITTWYDTKGNKILS
ncbi:MAG: hypothetical protein MUC31_08620, partial [Bacteroidales bacterium]|nr:hypothetical protein [Bacteroidales bacterium]